MEAGEIGIRAKTVPFIRLYVRVCTSQLKKNSLSLKRRISLFKAFHTLAIQSVSQSVSQSVLADEVSAFIAG